MDVLLSGFGAVFSVFILIVLGYALTRLGKIDDKISSFISWFVVNISLPCYMLHNVLNSFETSEIKNIPAYVAIPLISLCIGLAAGFIIAKFSHADKSVSGSLIVMTALNNTIFMGLPVNLAMFGAQSTPYVLYYYMANTLLFWTIGVFIISGGSSKSSAKEIIKRLIPPPLYGLFAGILILLYNSAFPPVVFPKSVNDTLMNIGNMTTPLSMIFIGHVLGAAGLKQIKLNRNIGLGFLGRFIVGPAIALAVFTFIPMPDLMKKVFIVQSFMPVMATQSITAKEFGADTYFPAVMVSLSTIASLVILPIVRILLT